MTTIMESLIAIYCFISLPALIAIIVQLYRLREANDDFVKISFIEWTLNNPLGIILIPIVTYFVCLFWSVHWKIQNFTEINISATIFVPTIYAGIISIGNYQFKNILEIAKMNIVQEVKKDNEERDRLAQEREKLAEARFEARLKEQREYYQEQATAQEQRHQETLKMLRGSVDQVALDQAYMRGKLDR
jgi:uncharacterized integral membrane protein